jgi:hypothetical protein
LIYKVQEGAYKPDEAEVDQFQINYSADELPHIKVNRSRSIDSILLYFAIAVTVYCCTLNISLAIK